MPSVHGLAHRAAEDDHHTTAARKLLQRLLRNRTYRTLFLTRCAANRRVTRWKGDPKVVLDDMVIILDTANVQALSSLQSPCRRPRWSRRAARRCTAKKGAGPFCKIFQPAPCRLCTQYASRYANDADGTVISRTYSDFPLAPFRHRPCASFRDCSKFRVRIVAPRRCS